MGRWSVKWCAVRGRGSNRPIFVVGTGRSGTHWLGHTLEAHPEIRATIETRPVFGWVTRMALEPREVERLLPRLLLVYRVQLALSAPRHYLDKSHPAMWIAEELLRGLPQARFIGIQRNPYATVASMLRHAGVRAWHERWREFSVPNRFLGITSDIAPRYEGMSLAAKCALRWRAHAEELERLRSALGESLFVLHYESLMDDTEPTLAMLREFLGLREAIPHPTVGRESAWKWRAQLDSAQQRAIEEIVGFGPSQVGGWIAGASSG